MTWNEEIALVIEAKHEGGQDAKSTLYLRHRAKAAQLVWTLLQDHAQEVDDIVQDAFEEALESFDVDKASTASSAPFLWSWWTYGRWRALDYLKKQERQVDRLPEDLPVAEIDEADPIAPATLPDQVQALVAELLELVRHDLTPYDVELARHCTTALLFHGGRASWTAFARDSPLSFDETYPQHDDLEGVARVALGFLGVQFELIPVRTEQETEHDATLRGARVLRRLQERGVPRTRPRHSHSGEATHEPVIFVLPPVVGDGPALRVRAISGLRPTPGAIRQRYLKYLRHLITRLRMRLVCDHDLYLELPAAGREVASARFDQLSRCIGAIDLEPCDQAAHDESLDALGERLTLDWEAIGVRAGCPDFDALACFKERLERPIREFLNAKVRHEQ